MRIDILTLFPQMIDSFMNESILGRAQKGGFAQIVLHDIRDYTTDRHHKADDYSFGGSAGLVMKVEPIYRLITELKSQRNYDEIIYTSPDGEQFNQPMANSLSLLDNVIILCGHYKGIDHRIREHLITKEISIGDYVLTGGELAAAVMTDAIVRLIPGVLTDEQSALSDSFQDNLLAPPVYTRPREFNGWSVPDVLLSGNQALIDQWQMDQAMERTLRLRPDLLK
ncbi:MAG: tRNA (guanosine(37)-N1)-methyltransferase TrmD [Bacteroidaceae bacterium]|nr:tRNA (guanosine(37)-N1)-methyltransferase TrmD [Bacteroidaceae bacterium]